MSVTTPDTSTADRFEYVLRLADDSLIYSHRLGEWITWAPQLEEDLALANISLDLLGQARLLLTYAGELEGEGRTEDDLAYLREERDFRCSLLVEQPMEHEFGDEMARLLFFAAYAVPLWSALTDSSDGQIADIAAKSVKEARYHLEHAADWVIRLGDGTADSHRRMQAGLDAMWLWTGELFQPDELTGGLARAGVAADPEPLKREWDRTVADVVEQSTLTLPTENPREGTGRRGVHSEHLGYLLAEMQYLHRLHPGAHW